MRTEEMVITPNTRKTTVLISILSILLCTLSIILRAGSTMNNISKKVLCPHTLQANIAATILDNDLYHITIELLQNKPQVIEHHLSTIEDDSPKAFTFYPEAAPLVTLSSFSVKNDLQRTAPLHRYRYLRRLLLQKELAKSDFENNSLIKLNNTSQLQISHTKTASNLTRRLHPDHLYKQNIPALTNTLQQRFLTPLSVPRPTLLQRG